VRTLLRAPGKPFHPPLTDASIGAYTAGAVMLVLGALGVEEEQMAHGALLALSLGLILAAPTALTGLLDWLDIPKGTPARTVATLHLWVMVTATVLFALTWLAQLGGYKDDEVRGLALALGLAAFAFLALGGNIGGANVFVYGIRVLKAESTPPKEALNPFGVGEEKAPRSVPEPAPGEHRGEGAGGQKPPPGLA
jgi:uncharacterized membrane protein